MFKQFLDEFLTKAVEYVAGQAVSDALNIKNFKHILETLEKKFKLLSARASDVEEEIKNAELSGRKKRKREVEEWLEQVKSIEKEVDGLGSQGISEGIIMRFLDGGKAAQLDDQVETLLQHSLNFGEPVLDVCGSTVETLLTNELVGDVFNENMERILKLLENRQVSKIGVYGMGGAGKTTLAKHIHNQLVQQSQGRVFWITVSQEFTVKSLQDKIARCLGVDLSDEDEEARRAGRLNRCLSQMKNSVLILDDVWGKIDMLKVGCTFSVESCRLIVTTRFLQVCRHIDCREIIKVVKLCEDEAWKLFSETLGKEMKLSPQVEGIAKSMAALCDGLPLGIITVAGSMKGETTIHMWRNALADLQVCVAGGQDEMGQVEEVFKVLKYSFDRLNTGHGNESNGFNRIQLCFLYCSFYPEDEEIRRDDLAGKLISDGLLDERRSRRAQVEQGLFILDNLVNVCLLESCVNFDNDECVKMHDLVRAMALMIGEGKYMVRSGSSGSSMKIFEEEWTKDLEKASFMLCRMERIEDGISPNCPNLSTLLIRHTELNYIPDSFFSKMQGLCTLDLSWNRSITMLPDSISDMTRLKSLRLEFCFNLEKVPYLGKLKALRELNLSRTSIKEAPQGLEELLNLRSLSINAEGLKMLPRGVLLKFGHIQHLNLRFTMQIEELKGLKQLEEFSGGLENVSDFNWLVTTQGVHGTCCYRIVVNSENIFGLLSLGLGYLDVKKNELVLCESNLKDEKVLGQGIVHLRILKCEGMSKCFGDDLSGVFNNPTSLEVLNISDCGEIEWIMRSNGQIPNTLQWIHLSMLKNVKGVVMERENIRPSTTAPPQALVFSSLHTLIIQYCNKMRKVGLPVSGLPNLTSIYITNCCEIEEIFIEDEGRTASSIISTLPKLSYLRLEDLPRLKSVSKATIISNSICDISIRKCPRLKKLPLMPLHMVVPPPPTLGRIEVERKWWESLEWDINLNLPRLLLPLVEFLDE